MIPISIKKWNTYRLDHQIELAERKALRLAKIFNKPLTDFLPSNYAAMVEERMFRDNTLSTLW